MVYWPNHPVPVLLQPRYHSKARERIVYVWCHIWNNTWTYGALPRSVSSYVYSMNNWAKVYQYTTSILLTVSGSKMVLYNAICVIIYSLCLHKNELDYSFYMIIYCCICILEYIPTSFYIFLLVQMYCVSNQLTIYYWTYHVHIHHSTSKPPLDRPSTV